MYAAWPLFWGSNTYFFPPPALMTRFYLGRCIASCEMARVLQLHFKSSSVLPRRETNARHFCPDFLTVGREGWGRGVAALLGTRATGFAG